MSAFSNACWLALSGRIQVKRLFNKIDIDGGGALDRKEVGTLLQETGLSLSEAQADYCFKEMSSGGGTGEGEGDGGETPRDISLEQFRRWWFLKKNSRPPMIKCPESFLDMMACRMRSDAFGVDEFVVPIGDYGSRLVILLAGEVSILKGDVQATGGSLTPAEQRDESNDQRVSADDKEPVVGIAATLPEAAFQQLSFNDDDQTTNWAAKSLTYVDTASLSRADLLACFAAEWETGLDHMQVGFRPSQQY